MYCLQLHNVYLYNKTCSHVLTTRTCLYDYIYGTFIHIRHDISLKIYEYEMITSNRHKEILKYCTYENSTWKLFFERNLEKRDKKWY